MSCSADFIVSFIALSRLPPMALNAIMNAITRKIRVMNIGYAM
jgi:hypothetical protein